MKRCVSAIPKSVEDVVSRIRDLHRANKFVPKYAAVVSAAVRKYPRSADVRLAAAEYRQLADGHKRVFHLGRRVSSYRRVLELDPKNARAWENLAAVLDIGERYAEAAQAAQKAIRFGDDPDAVAILARIRAQQGRKAEARRLATSVLRSRSEFARLTAKEVMQGFWK